MHPFVERTTDDGYPLYDVKELNIGLGGGEYHIEGRGGGLAGLF